MNDFFKEKENELILQAQKYLPAFRATYQMQGTEGLIKSVYYLADMILEKSGIKEKASCNNCSFCCHDTIMVSRLEAEYIKGKLNLYKITPNRERKLLQRKNPNLKLKFMGRACPMLADEDENGHRKCSIYEFRPMVCRAHNSMEDIKFCNKEEYPNRFIHEGRILEVEAINFALLMLEGELGINGKFPHMAFMHDL